MCNELYCSVCNTIHNSMTENYMSTLAVGGLEVKTNKIIKIEANIFWLYIFVFPVCRQLVVLCMRVFQWYLNVPRGTFS